MKKGLHLLNVLQFFAALNENLVKMLCALFVIHIVGADDASEVVTKTGSLFLIPFLLFSTLGGLLADKYSKSNIIRVTRLLELISYCLFFFAILLQSTDLAYILLFILASISAIFSPSKYSIIPEYTTKKKLLAANSLISAFTFLGIILGTGLASFLIEITNLHFLLASAFAIAVALLNLILSFFLPHTSPKFQLRKIDALFIREFFLSLAEMKRIGKLLPASLAFAYFLFIGSFVQLNIIPFAIESLHLSALMGGYLFMITAIGLSIGAAVTSKILHGRVKLIVVPYAGFAISIATIVMALATQSVYITLVMLFLLGFFAGIFLIPPTTYVLSMSPDPTRGRNFSTANLLSFLFALIAPLAIYFFNVRLEFTAARSFIAIAVINLIIMALFLNAFRGARKAKL